MILLNNEPVVTNLFRMATAPVSSAILIKKRNKGFGFRSNDRLSLAIRPDNYSLFAESWIDFEDFGLVGEQDIEGWYPVLDVMFKPIPEVIADVTFVEVQFSGNIILGRRCGDNLWSLAGYSEPVSQSALLRGLVIPEYKPYLKGIFEEFITFPEYE